MWPTTLYLIQLDEHQLYINTPALFIFFSSHAEAERQRNNGTMSVEYRRNKRKKHKRRNSVMVYFLRGNSATSERRAKTFMFKKIASSNFSHSYFLSKEMPERRAIISIFKNKIAFKFFPTVISYQMKCSSVC
jgi:hypothetical protein